MRKGAEFEELAVKYLEGIGYKVIHRNYHCRVGEIDIIALDGDTVVFVEVKGGKTTDFGDPAERVDRKKMERLLRCIEHYLHKYPSEDYRLDVIVIRNGEIEHIKGVELY
ncbi:YraN family protein [Hydrogenobacter sp. T-2]|uniref:YraN family protein n=1 Tax=Pampinifervens diazotrophicum TaxID=1632018 RepID=UPI002B260405|nr:YraN family protein [Hydrogenobacter sp. T-2]WPM32033.1 YraN family protein [Hydrogenobacter sp. T-2]